MRTLYLIEFIIFCCEEQQSVHNGFCVVKVHEFKVEMTCGGCSAAVERVLGKLKGQGIEDVKISLDDQIVRVQSTLPAEKLLETIKKTGKATSYIGVQN
uniref:Copper transport protein ATOX1 n=1 Tax=Timema douglasi TaxID=61478 RepID=A0A7R8VFN8_TIMDO|nr:unnamed protein product [Timema douglasi]